MTVAALSMSEGGLAIETELDGDHYVTKFTGVAELPAVTPLAALLKSLHSAALANGVKHVVADFRALEFMNSACFKNMVTWITDIQDEPSDKQYRLIIRSNEAIQWQRRSMHALKAFATELIDVSA